MITINGHDYAHYDIHYYGEGGQFLKTVSHWTRPPMATSSAEHLKADALRVCMFPAEAVQGIAEFAGLSVIFSVGAKKLEDTPDLEKKVVELIEKVQADSTSVQELIGLIKELPIHLAQKALLETRTVPGAAVAFLKDRGIRKIMDDVYYAIQEGRLTPLPEKK